MDVPINFIAVLLAAVSSMVVGTVYYLPVLFGNRLAALTGADRNKPKNPALTYILTFVAGLVTAYVLAYMSALTLAYFQTTLIVPVLVTAFFLWLGFTAARLLVNDLFDSRGLRVWAITAGHELITILVMAVIIGLLRP